MFAQYGPVHSPRPTPALVAFYSSWGVIVVIILAWLALPRVGAACVSAVVVLGWLVALIWFWACRRRATQSEEESLIVPY